jgi:hypothetical protein
VLFFGFFSVKTRSVAKHSASDVNFVYYLDPQN